VNRQVVNTKQNTSGLPGNALRALLSKTFDLNLRGLDRSECKSTELSGSHSDASSNCTG